MPVCLLCGKKDKYSIQNHHTVPKQINPQWTAKVPLCIGCHVKVHKYIINDLVTLIWELQEIQVAVNTIFNSTGIQTFAFATTELHSGIIRTLCDNVPNGIFKKDRISYREISDELGLEWNKRTGQRIGFIMRDLKINTIKTNKGTCAVYTDKTLRRLTKLKKLKI